MAVKLLPLAVSYDKQRFTQFSPQDCANWYPVSCKTGKREVGLYPTMGRRRVRYLQTNQLIFDAQPRRIFKSIDFFYVVVESQVYQVDKFFNKNTLVNPDFTKVAGDCYFAYLPTAQVPVGAIGTPAPSVFPVYCMITDGQNSFIINEKIPGQMQTVTDPKRPVSPLFVVAFANRFVISSRNSTQFNLTQVNLGKYPADPNGIFTVAGNAQFAQEAGLIRQMAVLHNQLYIFTDFSTGIWANIPSVFETTTFPFKKNSSYDWNYGIADPLSLDVGFDMMCWLAQNEGGLTTFMMSNGQAPKPISTQAINVLLQNSTQDELSPFITEDVHGFLYQYDNSIFYRASAGLYTGTQLLDDTDDAASLEYGFDGDTWHRCIELNGERNRIEQHIFFNHRHLTIVQGEKAIYEMAGNIYFNEQSNPAVTNPQDPLAFIAYPFRYEMVTPIISEPDYAEIKFDYVEIDFVWGDETFVNTSNPYANTVFIIDEQADGLGEPIYLVAEDGATFIIADGSDTPVLDETIYNDLFKPNIFLYFSDDGGNRYYPADDLEFSALGVFRWRMRWYQLGCSRNRCFKLVCVSPSPLVLLGAVYNAERVSGGAN